jgi:hypothetical protein
MEIIRKKICREDFISRNEVNYGQIYKPYVYVNFTLTQDVDNMGLFTDYPFIEKIVSEISKDDILKGYRPPYDIKHWFKTGDILTGRTTSKLNDLKGYKSIDRFKVDFDISREPYVDAFFKDVDGISRITAKNEDVIKYAIDANNDGFVGTENQTTGILYEDGIKNTDSELNKIRGDYGDTKFQFKAQGLNSTNSSLSAIAKEEYLMGIISVPEIDNDVFIDRGNNTVAEHHLRMSEIETLEHLINYGNGYYNVTR